MMGFKWKNAAIFSKGRSVGFYFFIFQYFFYFIPTVMVINNSKEGDIGALFKQQNKIQGCHFSGEPGEPGEVREKKLGQGEPGEF